jgi:transposase
MSMRISLKQKEYTKLLDRLYQAYALGSVRLIKRIEAVLDVMSGQEVADVAERLQLSESCVYSYVRAFILKGIASLAYQPPPGRAAKLTKTQKKELIRLIDKGPEAAGYDMGGWTTALIQDLIWRTFKVEYSVHYLAELLKTLGYSWQKARFVSDHLEDVSEEQREWIEQKWPEILRLAKDKQALILFGDEASFAQWGSLSYTWARRGHQPTVKTSGKRRAYKVWGFIEFFSGALYSMTQSGKLNSAQYQVFIKKVLAKTKQHLILIQDGATYHTSAATKQFFAAHTDRISVYQLPRYSPDFNPIEYLWRNLKKHTTHLRYFPTFEALVKKVDGKLRYFAKLPEAIKGLMGKYCKTLGIEAIA